MELELVSVRFIKNHSPYHEPEVADFSPTEAADLVRRLKVAEYVNPGAISASAAEGSQARGAGCQHAVFTFEGDGKTKCSDCGRVFEGTPDGNPVPAGRKRGK